MCRKHFVDYVTLVVLFIVLSISETLRPFERRIYHESQPGHPSELELWRYSMPLRDDTVPPWAVPMIALFIPAALFVAFHIIYKCGSSASPHLLECIPAS